MIGVTGYEFARGSATLPVPEEENFSGERGDGGMITKHLIRIMVCILQKLGRYG